MKKFLAIFALLALFAVKSSAYVTVLTDNSGNVVGGWTNLFNGNILLLSNALVKAGFQVGGGTGGSATNALANGPGGIFDASLVTNVQGSAITGPVPSAVAANSATYSSFSLSSTNAAVATNDSTGRAISTLIGPGGNAGSLTNLSASQINGTIPIGNIPTTVTTNDPIVTAFIAANAIQDANAQARLAKCVADLRTMSKWTNLIRFFIFDAAYNPTNRRDLFGNAINWSGEQYAGFGAAFRRSNSAFIPLSTPLTNFTVGVWRKNPNPSAGQGGTLDVGLEFSLENTNTDAFNWAWSYYFREPLAVNYQNTYMYGSNWNNVGGGSAWTLQQTWSAGAGNRPSVYVVPPTVWTFSCMGGTNMSGYADTEQMTVNASTNLLGSTRSLSNTTPVQVIYLGGSTNWLNGGYRNYSGAPATNGSWDCDVFALFNDALNTNDLNIFYTALHELPANRTEYFISGDSMMGEGNNQIYPFDGAGAYTNFSGFFFMQAQPPGTMWHDIAQGGSDLYSFGTMYPGPSTLLPPDITKIFITDYPRNDLQSNVTTVNFPLLNKLFTTNFTPWVSGLGRVWLNESVQGATNSPLYLGTIAISNLVNGYLSMRTNPLVARDFNTIDYWYGGVLDTNAGFYGWSTQINNTFVYPGVHIEGTNSISFHIKEGKFWNTGMWPDAPFPYNLLPYNATLGNYSAGFPSTLVTNGESSVTLTGVFSGDGTALTPPSAVVQTNATTRILPTTNVVVDLTAIGATITKTTNSGGITASVTVSTNYPGGISIGSSASDSGITWSNSVQDNPPQALKSYIDGWLFQSPTVASNIYLGPLGPSPISGISAQQVNASNIVGNLIGNASGATNYLSTNLVTSAGVLASASAQTNFTVNLLPGELDNLQHIYTANTNCFFSFTGTNQADWGRTVIVDCRTNTMPVGFSTITINLPNYFLNTNSASFIVSNGWIASFNFYNLDTTGSNCIVSDASRWQRIRP